MADKKQASAGEPLPAEARSNTDKAAGADSGTAGRLSGDALASSAAELAAINLAVLPLLPRSKIPRAGSHGYLDATTDAERIDRHWYYHPRDNIGVRPPLGMIVLDVDPRNGGRASLARVIAEHGPLPPTWKARTGSGGRHLWFVVGEMPDVASKLLPGIDIKHGGSGFVVVPPSIHPCGGRYEWLIPPFGEPAPAPEWLREMLRPKRYEPPAHPGTASRNGGHGPFSAQCLVARILAAPEGSRHVRAYGAFLDAARQGDLAAFLPDLEAAALAAERTPAEIAAFIRYARENT